MGVKELKFQNGTCRVRVLKKRHVIGLAMNSHGRKGQSFGSEFMFNKTHAPSSHEI
jgi:hypothetical protein